MDRSDEQLQKKYVAKYTNILHMHNVHCFRGGIWDAVENFCEDHIIIKIYKESTDDDIEKIFSVVYSDIELIKKYGFKYLDTYLGIAKNLRIEKIKNTLYELYILKKEISDFKIKDNVKKVLVGMDDDMANHLNVCLQVAEMKDSAENTLFTHIDEEMLYNKYKAENEF